MSRNVYQAGNSIPNISDKTELTKQNQEVGILIEDIQTDVTQVFQGIDAIKRIASNFNDVGRQMLNIIDSATMSDDGTITLSRNDGIKLKECIKCIMTNSDAPDKDTNSKISVTVFKETKPSDQLVYILDTFSSDAERKFCLALKSELAARKLTLMSVKLKDFNDEQHEKHHVLVVCNNASRAYSDLKPTLGKIDDKRHRNVCLIFLHCKTKPNKPSLKYPEDLNPIPFFFDMTFNTDNPSAGLKDPYNDDFFTTITALVEDNQFCCKTCRENATTSMLMPHERVQNEQTRSEIPAEVFNAEDKDCMNKVTRV